MRRFRSIIGWTTILLSMLIAPAVRADDPFGGGWQVKCTPSRSTLALGADTFDDGFLFENGQFSAQAYAGLGFTPADYSVDSSGKFTATLASTERGTVVWVGRASGSTIRGRINWTKPDGTLFKFYFTGTAIVNDPNTVTPD